MKLKTLQTMGLALAAASSLALAQASTASACTIFGTLEFDGDPANYYDPGNGDVPPGYGNSDGEPVDIGPGVEFGYDDGDDMDTADFSGHTLLIHEVVSPDGGGGRTQHFSGSFFEVFSELSVDDGQSWIPSGQPATGTSNGEPMTATLNGDELTLRWDGPTPPGAYDFAILFGVPEPSTWAMMALGFGGLGAMLRRQRRRVACA